MRIYIKEIFRKSKKHLSFGSLSNILCSLFDNLPDNRQTAKTNYDIRDAMMSGFACMFFQDEAKVLGAMSIIMFQVISLIFKGVKTLIFHFPAASTAWNNRYYRYWKGIAAKLEIWKDR